MQYRTPPVVRSGVLTVPDTPMTYLFQLSTRYRDVQVTYNISQVQFDEYFAESTNLDIESFFLKRKSGVWICEGGFEEFQAAKIGQLIDEQYLSIMQN